MFSRFSHLLGCWRNQLPDRLLNCPYPTHAVRALIDIAGEIDQTSEKEQRTVKSQGMRTRDHFQRDHAERQLIQLELQLRVKRFAKSERLKTCQQRRGKFKSTNLRSLDIDRPITAKIAGSPQKLKNPRTPVGKESPTHPIET